MCFIDVQKKFEAKCVTATVTSQLRMNGFPAMRKSSPNVQCMAESKVDNGRHCRLCFGDWKIYCLVTISSWSLKCCR